jgi:benzoate-CoA ligase family protein
MTANIASWFVDRNVEEGAGDRVALIHDEGQTTYAELARLTNRTGNALLGLGVTTGDRVLLALGDGLEFVAMWYGAQKVGAVTAEAYTFLTAKDYAYFLGYTGAAAVVVDAWTLGPMREAMAMADGMATRLLVVGLPESQLGDGEHSYGALIETSPDELEAAPVVEDDIAIWKFTTGSTGAPKACAHRASSPRASFEAYARGVLSFAADDVVLAVPKLFFGYARDLVALYPFGVGASGVAFTERTTPELLFDLIARHRPTILVNVPTMMSAMVAHPVAATADLSCLRLCTSAGEALPADLHARWDDTFGVEVIDGIGSSEAYHIYISNRPGATRRGSVGTPVPGYAARVVDEDRQDVADGDVGILEVTGPTIAREYVGDPERTARTFDGDTVRTGDLFSRDADGHFHHHGRADDLLKVGGIWVAPSEIEHCLAGHPEVLECGVVGHSEAGLVRPRAYVVLRPAATATPQALTAYAGERLAGHKRPRQVVVVEQLPRTPNGKLDRRALAAIDGGGS